MSKRILDTEVLISHYNKMTKSKSVETVKAHAQEFIVMQDTTWILWPIRIEFLCGARDRNELILIQAIAKRLNAEVVTWDRDFRQRTPPKQS